MLYRLRSYPFTCLLGIAIVLLSLLSVPEVELVEDIPLFDKWAHMVMYGVLTSVVFIESLCGRRPLSVLKVFLAPILLGGLLELAQAYLTTSRSGEWLDFVANTIGVCIGVVIGYGVKVLCFRSSSK